jgi:catechol 2,3-dioxygenase-like lactoylglutathione lyase family enzyme
MAVLGSLGSVSVFVKDRKRAKEFYVRKVGLKVREEMKDMGFLALGATKGGKDASLLVWQPNREAWGEDYDDAVASIGTVTGIGFGTEDIEGTVKGLKRRGVKVSGYEPGGTFGTFSDPDGNVFFMGGPRKPKVRRAGFGSLAFVTVVSRDADRAGAWFTKALGMKRFRMPGEGSEEFVGYRLSRDGTMIGPFTPARDMYDNPKDYDEDLAHIGEDTGIVFPSRDIQATQEALMARGVRFNQKAEPTPWGGWDAEFLDLDDNVYTIIQRRGATRKP